MKKRELKNLRDGMSPEDRIGAWLSAALEDPMVCDEMKQDIKDWFDQTNDRIECPRCGRCCQIRQAAEQAVEVMDAHMMRSDTDEFYEAKEALRRALEGKNT